MTGQSSIENEVFAGRWSNVDRLGSQFTKQAHSARVIMVLPQLVLPPAVLTDDAARFDHIVSGRYQSDKHIQLAYQLRPVANVKGDNFKGYGDLIGIAESDDFRLEAVYPRRLLDQPVIFVAQKIHQGDRRTPKKRAADFNKFIANAKKIGVLEEFKLEDRLQPNQIIQLPFAPAVLPKLAA